MSSENPHWLPLPRTHLSTVLATKNVPLSQMSHCPTLVHHQEINAGTRNDLPDICSLHTRAHSVIQRTHLTHVIQLIQTSLVSILSDTGGEFDFPTRWLEGLNKSMSLTSHLKSTTSPIGQFIQQRFAHTANLTKAANQQLRSATTLRPAVAEPGYPYSILGTALDYRIRYNFAITPYRRLVAWQGAIFCALKLLESDDDIEVECDELEEIMRNGAIPFDIISYRIAQGPYAWKLIKSFFERLEATLHTLQPVGRQLELQAEQMLARYCYVLALFEEVYRNGLDILLQRSPLFVPTMKRSVEELLAVPQAAWIDDLCAVSTLFCERFQPLLSLPHVLNPTFAGSNDVGGADADMVIDGCLIDIKSTIEPKLKPNHLHQIAGYLLLDYDDRLHINALGIYMARQGMLFSWPVSEFLRQLIGSDAINLTSLRQEFRTVCESYRK